MKKLIVLPGDVNSPFFLNEIPWLRDNFDELVIISYQDSVETHDKTQRTIGLDYHTIRERDFVHLLSKEGLKWLLSKEVLREIRQNCIFKPNFLKKFAYILLYGIYVVQVRQIIDKEINASKDCDIYLYSYWLSRPAYAIAMFRSVRDKVSIKHIFSRAHGYDVYLYRNNLNYIPFRNFVDANLDSIFFISDDGLHYFQEKISSLNSSTELSKKRVLKLGTSNNDNLVKLVVRKEFICIASCSSVLPVKRLDLIIDLIAQIKDEVEVKWIHVGSGPLIDKIREYASFKLKDVEYHLLGRIENARILRAYAEHDVDFFVNMSDSEGIPVSMMEAMSFGLPIIARPVGGVSEIVNNEFGLLLADAHEPENQALTANFIRQRLDDEQAYKKRSVNARLKWEAEYSAEKNYEELIHAIWRDTDGKD